MSNERKWKMMYYYNEDNKYALYRTTSINFENITDKTENLSKSVPLCANHGTVDRLQLTKKMSKPYTEEKAYLAREKEPRLPRSIRLTEYQRSVLEDQFKRWPKVPHTGDTVLLAAETGLSETDVQDWYAMRLAQWRKEQGLGASLGLR